MLDEIASKDAHHIGGEHLRLQRGAQRVVRRERQERFGAEGAVAVDAGIAHEVAGAAKLGDRWLSPECEVVHGEIKQPSRPVRARPRQGFRGGAALIELRQFLTELFDPGRREFAFDEPAHHVPGPADDAAGAFAATGLEREDREGKIPPIGLDAIARRAATALVDGEILAGDLPSLIGGACHQGPRGTDPRGLDRSQHLRPHQRGGRPHQGLRLPGTGFGGVGERQGIQVMYSRIER